MCNLFIKECLYVYILDDLASDEDDFENDIENEEILQLNSNSNLSRRVFIEQNFN